MRNILITVMMLVVVALMFNAIIADDTNGTRTHIETHGKNTNSTLKDMTP
jgi:hypothetical protein